MKTDEKNCLIIKIIKKIEKFMEVLSFGSKFQEVLCWKLCYDGAMLEVGSTRLKKSSLNRHLYRQI
jgi:hypothetical protein